MAIPRYHDERLGLLPEEFFLAFGHLQYAYTHLEVNLTCIINSVVTVGYDPLQHPHLHTRVDAIMGGMRMDAIKDTLKRLLRVMQSPKEMTTYFDNLMAQLSEIQYFRNRLTHYPTHISGDKIVNSDLGIVKEDQKAVAFSFDIDTLEAARHDIHALQDVTSQLFDFELDSFALTPPAWQYKPSMLIR